MPIIETAGKKLWEAREALVRMHEQEQKAFGDKTPFDHHLSAFLSAAESVHDAFHVRQNRQRNRAIKDWKASWESELDAKQARLCDFMRNARDKEVHHGGTGQIVKQKEIKVGYGGTYSDNSGTLQVMGSPPALISADTSATIVMPEYFFNIAGAERRVSEACEEYLNLLEQMVAQYKADKTN
jgi:hypothetical protein